MNATSRYLLGGLVLGVMLTVCAALFVGPTVNVTSSVQNRGGGGRYTLDMQSTDEGTTYSVFDNESGIVRVFKSDGTQVTLGPEDKTLEGTTEAITRPLETPQS